MTLDKKSKSGVRTWKIKPWYNKPHYYTVKIFNKKEDMWKYAQQKHIVGNCDTNFRAITHSAKRDRLINGRWHTDKEWLGTQLFCLEHIGSEVVSHEMTHAALYWMARVKKKKTITTMQSTYHDNGVISMHEKLCMVVGEMTKIFWQKYYKHIMPTELK